MMEAIYNERTVIHVARGYKPFDCKPTGAQIAMVNLLSTDVTLDARVRIGNR